MNIPPNKKLVISAVNLVDGGPFSILRECLRYLHDMTPEGYEVIVLAHKKSKLQEFTRFTILEFPQVKQSWIKRVVFEYWKIRKISRKLSPDIWLSLHDMTPSASASVRAVYCHNASPFYNWRLKDIKYNYKLVLFALFYKFLYRINIHKNDYVIVQQEWLRQNFNKLFNIPLEKIVVSLPISIKHSKRTISVDKDSQEQIVTFFYPCHPRPFKNVELLGKAAAILITHGVKNFRIIVTFDGTENKYSEEIVQSYQQYNMHFIGLVPYEKVLEIYEQADCLLFPSKLESWGLPISEFKHYSKPMLVADLPYAYETVGDYSKALFFNPSDAKQLVHYMTQIIDGKSILFAKTAPTIYRQPFAQDWGQLFSILLQATK